MAEQTTPCARKVAGSSPAGAANLTYKLTLHTIKGITVIQVKNRTGKVMALAELYGWQFLENQENIGMLSFTKQFEESRARINVYLTTMTVGTCIEHPKRGKTQLFRRGVGYKELLKIFQNPRVHTGKGYYTKK